MEHAKKMFLIDEREYDRLTRPQQIKNELSWKRPIEIRAKNEEHRNIKSILGDSNLSDDVKSKAYNQTLTRFLNTKPRVETGNLIELGSDDHQTQISQPQQPEEKNIKKSKNKKKKRTISVPYSPIKTRKRRPVKKFNTTEWIEY